MMKLTGLALGLLLSFSAAAQVTGPFVPKLTDCVDTTGKHLNYTASTNLFSCGTSTSGVSAASPTFTGTVTYPPTMSMYAWTQWDPSDVAGTETNASATAASTIAATTYVTAANSSGTVTFTFAKAGNYLVTTTISIASTSALTFQYNAVTIGGTATVSLAPAVVSLNTYTPGPGLGAVASSITFTVVATASQTLTILPKVRVISGGGATTSWHTNAVTTVSYQGT